MSWRLREQIFYCWPITWSILYSSVTCQQIEFSVGSTVVADWSDFKTTWETVTFTCDDVYLAICQGKTIHKTDNTPPSAFLYELGSGQYLNLTFTLQPGSHTIVKTLRIPPLPPKDVTFHKRYDNLPGLMLSIHHHPPPHRVDEYIISCYSKEDKSNDCVRNGIRVCKDKLRIYTADNGTEYSIIDMDVKYGAHYTFAIQSMSKGLQAENELIRTYTGFEVPKAVRELTALYKRNTETVQLQITKDIESVTEMYVVRCNTENVSKWLPCHQLRGLSVHSHGEALTKVEITIPESGKYKFAVTPLSGEQAGFDKKVSISVTKQPRTSTIATIKTTTTTATTVDLKTPDNVTNNDTGITSTSSSTTVCQCSSEARPSELVVTSVELVTGLFGVFVGVLAALGCSPFCQLCKEMCEMPRKCFAKLLNSNSPTPSSTEETVVCELLGKDTVSAENISQEIGLVSATVYHTSEMPEILQQPGQTPLNRTNLVQQSCARPKNKKIKQSILHEHLDIPLQEMKEKSALELKQPTYSNLNLSTIDILREPSNEGQSKNLYENVNIPSRENTHEEYADLEVLGKKKKRVKVRRAVTSQSVVSHQNSAVGYSENQTGRDSQIESETKRRRRRKNITAAVKPAGDVLQDLQLTEDHKNIFLSENLSQLHVGQKVKRKKLTRKV